jgi:hypothetical protein
MDTNKATANNGPIASHDEVQDISANQAAGVGAVTRNLSARDRHSLPKNYGITEV